MRGGDRRNYCRTGPVTNGNLSGILGAADATLGDVIRGGVFLAKLADLHESSGAYVHTFGTRIPAMNAVAAHPPG